MRVRRTLRAEGVDDGGGPSGWGRGAGTETHRRITSNQGRSSGEEMMRLEGAGGQPQGSLKDRVRMGAWARHNGDVERRSREQIGSTRGFREWVREAAWV